MRKGNNVICKICGKTIKPGGIGGHLRLAHRINDVRDVRDVRGEVRRDAREQYANSLLLYKKEENRKDTNPTAEKQEPAFIREANILQKKFRLISSLKALTENRLDEMMKDYVLNNNSSDCYLQKHKVLDNYWCCWVWRRRP